jgi:hypothetical protein
MNDNTAGIDRWLAGRDIPDRDLEPDELAALADALGAQHHLWQQLEQHTPEERHYFRLRRDHHLEAWLICWMPSQDTGLHDHDLSSGAVRVVRGEIAEERLVIGQPQPTVTEFRAGEGFTFDASRIHNVRHSGSGASTSLHLYSPPLWRMGYYEVAADGGLARRSATYVEELGAGR